jgi:arylsulfatase A-like enzyme
LLQVLSSTPPAVSTWRHAFLLEHWLPTGITVPDASPLEPPDADDLYAIGDTIPEYHAVRTARHKYVEYVTGEKELYDLAVDPYELTNIVATAPAGLRNRLHAKLGALQVCAGESCRVADQ